MRRGRWVALATVLLIGCTSDPGVSSSRADQGAGTTIDGPSTTAPTSEPEPTDPSDPPTTEGTEPPHGVAGVGDPLFPDLGFAGIDVQHYDVGITYDPSADTIAGSVGADVTLTEPLEQVALDAVGLDVESVKVDGQTATFAVAAKELWVDLPEPLAAGVTVHIDVAYSGAPNAESSPAGIPNGWFHTEGGSYVLNEPDGARTWMPCNDHPSDKASFTFTITVPTGMTAVANGALASHTFSAGSETWVWDEALPMATYLIQLMTGDYVVIEGEGPGGLPMLSVALRDDEAIMQPYLDATVEQLAFFTEQFGPYPLDRYGIALTDSFGGLAMETFGRSLFSREDLTGGLDFVAQLLLSHELAHQWFGDAVTPAQWGDIWLNESFATYAQWMWTDHAGYGSLDDSATWALQQRGPSATGTPAVEELFGFNVYDGGAVVLHALRRTIGDDAFFTLLRRWVADNMGQSRTTDDFIALAEEVSGSDLGTFFDTWLFAAQTPAAYP